MSIQQSDFMFVRELVLARSAIVLEAGKEYLVEARLGPLARDSGHGSIAELVEALRRAPSGPLTTRVVEAITTHETSFFRDNHPFESLRDHVLPALLARPGDAPIHLWSAACSSGQEPYSIAMLLEEHFGGRIEPAASSARPGVARLRIIATDLSEQVLERARSGRFRQLEVNRGLPAHCLTKYFTRSGLEWQVGDRLKRWIDFRPLNLIGDWGALPRFDIVFMRNVLIYFDVETKKRILGRVRRTMSREGWLFLGSAETTLNIDESFRRVQAQRGNAFQCAA